MFRHRYIRDSGILNTDKNRFYSNIIINGINECFLWRGTTKSNGYGQFKTLNKKWIHAHRYSYEFFIGKIPDDLCILHKCDNRRCVNPEHLWVGTKKDNTHDMYRKKRNGYSGSQGENNPKSKLKEKDVKEIRESHSKGINCTTLSKTHGVSISAIDRIVRNITWRNL
jgi:hypothetical protein